MNNLPFETWPYKAQTEFKHKVFQEYFNVWVKILGRYHRLNYMDCFAGCGAYKKNQTIHFGSPIIAAEIIKKNDKTATLVIIDTEKKDLDNIKKILDYRGLSALKVLYVNQDFDQSINEILDEIKDLAPTFFFIDPWGYSIRYSTLKRIMNNNRSEILLNFMFNAINRFLSLGSVEETTNNLFGSEEWKSILGKKGVERETALLSLYKSQLKKIAKFVLPCKVEFPGKKRTFYYLFHLTNHPKGCSIMKSCFAKYTFGRLEYLGERGSQLRLFEAIGETKIEDAKKHLTAKYNNSSKSFFEIIEENIDSTKYLENELSNALKKLESQGKIHIQRFPKTTEKTKRLRSSIKEEDLIHFNKYPVVKRKSLLYKTKVEYGNFTINHVLGCAHGCNYPCYARMLAIKYGQIKNYEDWMHPRVVANALELLDKEIPKYKKEIDFVHLSFTTDPFMYDMLNKRTYPHIKELTLKILEKLNSNGIKCTVLTKGLYPKVLASNRRFSKENEYGITLVSLNKSFKKDYEPYSSPFDLRIDHLKYLNDKGLKTWVSIEPYPTPNIVKQDLDKILGKISFVDKIIFGKMNYNVHSNKFSNNKQFYKECAEKVINFCNENGIKYHIKEGTPYSTDQTRIIFKEGN
ncbi:MAG: three-Cys-motif partner protein TcmP [Candidatus Helarchaeota archaeon]|nr:three-Cys-motif partner protein TcmP [Candidatus Helarchaeota archaeon]